MKCPVFETTTVLEVKGALIVMVASHILLNPVFFGYTHLITLFGLWKLHLLHMKW